MNDFADKLREFAVSRPALIAHYNLETLHSLKQMWWEQQSDLKLGDLTMRVCMFLGKQINDADSPIAKYYWSAGNVQVTITGDVVRVMVDGEYVFDPDEKLCVPGNWIECMLEYYPLAEQARDEYLKDQERQQREDLLELLSLNEAKW